MYLCIYNVQTKIKVLKLYIGLLLEHNKSHFVSMLSILYNISTPIMYECCVKIHNAIKTFNGRLCSHKINASCYYTLLFI